MMSTDTTVLMWRDDVFTHTSGADKALFSTKSIGIFCYFSTKRMFLWRNKRTTWYPPHTHTLTPPPPPTHTHTYLALRIYIMGSSSRSTAQSFMFLYCLFYNVIKWMFSYWPCYRSEGGLIGLRIAVLARGEAEDQYGHRKANTTGRGQALQVTMLSYKERQWNWGAKASFKDFI